MAASNSNQDEFDRWLLEGASPAPQPVKVAAASSVTPVGNDVTTATSSASSWFSSIAKSAGVPTSLLSEIQSSAAALSTAVQSATLSDVAGKVRATIEDGVSAYNREAELYCTAEAQKKEQAELAHIVKDIHKTVVTGAAALPVGSSAAVAVADAMARPPLVLAAGGQSPSKVDGMSGGDADTHDTRWLDDAPPSLRPALEEAVLRLSENGDAFLVAADADERDEEELRVLTRCAHHALAFDERLRLRRFELVPSALCEGDFWRHYFLRVLRERRVLKLPRLREAVPPPAAHAAPDAVTDADELLLVDGGGGDAGGSGAPPTSRPSRPRPIGSSR